MAKLTKILSGFRGVLKQLDNLVRENEGAVTLRRTRIDGYVEASLREQAEITDLQCENVEALCVAQNLRKLLGEGATK